MSDLICYMNEHGLVTEREATAKGWAEAGTVVFVMYPEYEYGDVDLKPRPLSEVLRVHKEDTTQFPYAQYDGLAIVGKGYAASGWAVAGGEAVNPVEDADCSPTPGGVKFAFDAVKVSGEK